MYSMWRGGPLQFPNRQLDCLVSILLLCEFKLCVWGGEGPVFAQLRGCKLSQWNVIPASGRDCCAKSMHVFLGPTQKRNLKQSWTYTNIPYICDIPIKTIRIQTSLTLTIVPVGSTASGSIAPATVFSGQDLCLQCCNRYAAYPKALVIMATPIL